MMHSALLQQISRHSTLDLGPYASWGFTSIPIPAWVNCWLNTGAEEFPPLIQRKLAMKQN